MTVLPDTTALVVRVCSGPSCDSAAQAVRTLLEEAGVSAFPPPVSSRVSPVAVSITVTVVVALPTMGSEERVVAKELRAEVVGAGASASSPDGTPESSSGADGVG